MGVETTIPRGGFYLWLPAPDGDAWAFTRQLVEQIGLLVSPGEFYGSAGTNYVRIAAVQPDEKIEQLEQRVLKY
jgi:aspartate/methionine/tyrosine aminotransferase